MSWDKFVFCPSRYGARLRGADTHTGRLYDSVERFLKTKGWNSTEVSAEASLLVLIPRYGDRLTVEDARWLGQRCGNGAVVLIVDVRGSFVTPSENVLPWLHVARVSASKVNNERWLDQLHYWLNDRETLKKFALEKSTQFAVLQDILNWLLKSISGRAPDETSKIFTAWQNAVAEAGHSKFIGTKITPTLLIADSLLDYFYGLMRVSGNYTRIEHDLNRANQVLAAHGHPVSSKTLVTLGQLSCARRFIDGCTDLLQSLRHPVPNPTIHARNVILLIDDHPELIERELEDIRQFFLPSYKLCVWNPSRSPNHKESGELGLHTLAEYTSLRFREKLRDQKIKIRSADDAAEQSVNLERILNECAFVLVDLLFDMPDGSEDEAGCAAIRGLSRLIQDLSKLNHGNTFKRGITNPEIIAISRADDQQKIQAALLAGASGYLLKDRLLSMPAMLGRLPTPVTEPADAGHRTFRALYNLPRETIALLKVAKIDRIDFRHGLDPNANLTQTQCAMARLLQALPKTDLHVHVGSLMSPEFLAVASVVMLLRHKAEDKIGEEILESIRLFNAFFWGDEGAPLHLRPGFSFLDPARTLPLKFQYDDSAVKNISIEVKNFLVGQIRYFQDGGKAGNWQPVAINGATRERFYLFRSLLHRALDIRDHISPDAVIKKIESTPDIIILQFALAHATIETRNEEGTREIKAVFSDPENRMPDVMRMFVLHLVARQGLNVNILGTDCTRWFAKPEAGSVPLQEWRDVRKQFYEDSPSYPFSQTQMRERGWSAKMQWRGSRIGVSISKTPPTSNGPLAPQPNFEEAPLAWMLASGTRSSNLVEYLEGCELSGAEHLQHPFLIHLYAQHVVHKFAELGILYAEVRAAAAGYECADIKFSFSDACRCLVQAFQDAQEEHYNQFFVKSPHHEARGEDEEDTVCEKYLWFWDTPFGSPRQSALKAGRPSTAFPVKVGIILTGKRHKPTREMIREAAGAVVLHIRPPENLVSARDFVATQLLECRLVGFDLAGKEEGYPPERFQAEFEPLARLHIPITAHAGENAKSDYIESAVLDLRARRLGHGLALPEDSQLLGRVREDNVCIELCPVSNFQTSCFVPYGSEGREYPLRRFTENGNAVCINTDNPIISDTNIIKEYFQASYAYDVNGLPLWEALRFMRIGFVHSFMSLPERRAMLEIADQILFDYFSREDVVVLLRELARQCPASAPVRQI